MRDRHPELAVSSVAMTERTMGIVLLLAGVALLYLGVIDPLTVANKDAGDISILLKAAIIVPLALVYGVVYTFFTAWATRVLGTRRQPTQIGWIAILLLVVAGLLLHIWVVMRLEEMG
jgi:hypothetical protein